MHTKQSTIQKISILKNGASIYKMNDPEPSPLTNEFILCKKLPHTKRNKLNVDLSN